MADAKDFIPQEAEIDVEQAYYMDGVKNFSDDEDIVSHIKATVDDYNSRFTSQRQEWIEESSGIWNLQDAAWRSSINNSSVGVEAIRGANQPAGSERARLGTTQFFRQVTQMASNGYAVQTSKEMPFKYSALNDDAVGSDDAVTKSRSDKLNSLAKWSMKRDKFNLKSLEFWTQVKKYGNIPVMVEWKHKMGRKIIQIPVFDEDEPTKIIDYNLDEVDVIIDNRPVFTVLPIESVKADTVIGNIQDQECVIISSIVGMTDIVSGIKSGFYREDMISDIGTSQQWDGYSGFENRQEKKDNRGLENQPTDSNSGRYLKWEIYVNVPIDEKSGEWNELENLPMRYRVTMFGNTPQEAVVARVERNQEPDDTIPIEMVHANPHDSDILYHISNYEVIRGNISAETTLIRQVIDNGSLVNKTVLWEIKGEVEGNDREFKPGQRFILDNKDSMGQFNVRDISQSAIQTLQYLKEDSNTANSIDKNMIGESFGARTSASEAGTISSNSRRPNLVNIEYVMDQLLGFVANRYKVLWEAYGLPKQVIQITDENENLVRITPTDLAGEYDIVIDVMDDIKDDAVESQRMVNGAQVYASNSELAKTLDWAAFSEVLAETLFGTSKFVVAAQEGDAEANALNNIAQMLGDNGLPLELRFPALAPGMNLKKHLEVYKAERMRWNGNEDQNEFVTSVLDRVIEQIEARIDNPPAQGGGQQQPVVSQGEANRQELSGATGGTL